MYFYFRKIRPMETKILLRLIKDDILHLQGITDAFSMDSLPNAEEVELALVRSKALLQQLELLYKSMVKADIEPAIPVVTNEAKEVIQEVIPPVTEPNLIVAEPNLGIDFVAAPEPVYPAAVPAIQKEMQHIRSEPSEEAIIPDIQLINTEPDDIIPEPNVKDQAEPMGESNQIVNDLLTQGKSESGYPIIPIKSIWDGIGINDRFLFVRELFGNDLSRFEQSVASLDQLNTIQEAVNYLKMNFKWHKSEASQKFLVLVKRRFTN